jgi:SAM-dependent methyltransferase
MDTPSRTGPEAALATEAVLARLLPSDIRPFFDASFIRSYRLYEEFTYRLAVRVVREAGLEEVIREPVGAGEIATRAGLDPARALVPLDWLLRFLADRRPADERAGAGAGPGRPLGPLPAVDPAPVRDEQLRLDPSWMPAYLLAETVAGDYPAFLRGQVTGEDVLFSARRLRLWIDYFSNANGLYAVNNRVGAAAAVRWLPGAGGVVLELGGGLGSGALALLDRLEEVGGTASITEYRFTELVPAFLRRGEQALRARRAGLVSLAFGSLDMNEPFGQQGVAPGSVAMVFAVNTLHAAHDLEFTLAEVRRALAPGGRLVIAECVRPRAGQSIASEFVFNLAATFRSPRLHPRFRPSGGFLTPEDWTEGMRAAGFVNLEVLPDIARIRDDVPEFSVAAIGATRPS